MAQSQSVDRAYQGSLNCEQPGIGLLRTPLAMTVRDGRATASAPIFDIDGKVELSSVAATGTVDTGGTLRLAHTVSTREAMFQGEYTGTLNQARGTLTGTQVWIATTAGTGR